MEGMNNQVVKFYELPSLSTQGASPDTLKIHEEIAQLPKGQLYILKVESVFELSIAHVKTICECYEEGIAREIGKYFLRKEIQKREKSN